MAQQVQQQSLGPQTVGEAVSEFSVDLYKLIVNSSPAGENLFMSPYSVSAALMLTMLGTGGSSERQLKFALKIADVPSENVHDEYRKLHELLNAKRGDNVLLSVANRLFARQGLDIKKSYKSSSLKFYDSELELLDFKGKSEESRVRINTWIEEQTNHKIKELLPPGSVDAMSLIILTNAIYFKGDWARKFKEDRTTKEKFYISKNNSPEVDMMNMEKSKWRVGKSEDLRCKVLEMPYKGEQLSMLLVLPDEIEGLSELEQNLNANTLSTLSARTHNQDAIVSIPKFKMEARFELQKLLPKMGIEDIFDHQKADFSGMFESKQDGAYVSDVIHKAFIEVNEEGTEAAAATAIGIRLLSMPMEPFEFVADHPFLFFIKEKSTGTILFVGRYCKPV